MKAHILAAAAVCTLAVLAWLWWHLDPPGAGIDSPIPRTRGDTVTDGSAAREHRNPDADRRPDSGQSSGLLNERSFGCSSNDFLPERYRDKTDAELMEEQRARIVELTETLTSSDDLEHRLAAGLLKTGEEMPDAIEDIQRLLSVMPNNPILNWRVLDACDARPGYPLCASGEAEALVIATLGANGEAWAKIAHYRIKRGDDAGGLEALLSAASAAEFRDYWGTEAQLFFRSLPAYANNPVPERLIESIGLAAAMPAAELKLVNQCLLRATDSPDWRRACTAYGLRKEADAQTLIGKSIGLSLQDAMSRAGGEEQDPAKSRARDRQVLALFRDGVAEDGEVLLHSDENIGLAWLQRVANDGEFAANEFLRSEVARVRQIPGYDPCPPRLPQM